MKRILLFFLLTPFLTGCFGFTLEYDCVIQDVENTGNIPNEGSVIEVPMSYVFVQTKFQPGEYYQPFRYRALMAGKEYSYAETPTTVGRSEGETAFNVVVPRNNSYYERDITIEVSLAKSMKDQTWGDWRTVYSGTQDCVDKAQSLRPSVEKRVITFVFDGIVMEVEPADNDSARCLKDLLLDGDIPLEMYVANNIISTAKCDGIEKMSKAVPLNHTSIKKITRGDIYFSDYGGFTIENESYRNGTYGGVTYLGRLTGKSLESLDKICCGGDYFSQDTYPMLMTLK